MDAYIARQPIFDKDKKLFAYELLFRDGLSNFIPTIDGDTATSKVLASSFFTIGIDKITAGKRAFINFTENLLIKEVPLMFPVDSTVVEVLEDVTPTEEVVKSCKKFSSLGYTVALDDFVFGPNMEDLIACADIIKIDFRLTSLETIEDYIDRLPDNVKLLAEKVETNEEFNFALEMGFVYFQGYFFCKPEIIKGRDISSTNLSLMQIVSEANKANINFTDLESKISRDVSLSYKLLSYINSAFFRRREEVKSLKQALISLGENELRRFISLIALSQIASDKPNELLRNCCIKGKFCEKLGALSSRQALSEEMFALGLFSNIDAILDQPMVDIMDKLPLSQMIIDALVCKKGALVDYLLLSEHYVVGNWESVKEISLKLGIEESKIPSIYLEACEWADELPS